MHLVFVVHYYIVTATVTRACMLWVLPVSVMRQIICHITRTRATHALRLRQRSRKLNAVSVSAAYQRSLVVRNTRLVFGEGQSTGNSGKQHQTYAARNHVLDTLLTSLAESLPLLRQHVIVLYWRSHALKLLALPSSSDYLRA